MKAAFFGDLRYFEELLGRPWQRTERMNKVCDPWSYLPISKTGPTALANRHIFETDHNLPSEREDQDLHEQRTMYMICRIIEDGILSFERHTHTQTRTR